MKTLYKHMLDSILRHYLNKTITLNTKDQMIEYISKIIDKLIRLRRAIAGE